MGFEFIEFIKYIFLGIVQGITEVLPISSSGHVEILKVLIGLDMDQNVLFLILLNTGSLATFIIIYFRRLWALVKSFFIFVFKPTKRSENIENTVYLLKVLIACIPAGIVGILLKPLLESFMENYGILLAGLGLLLTATVIYFVSKIKVSEKEVKISWLDTLFIGLAQAVAIFPGVSRSGMTTSTALKRGIGITSALNFSFLMYIFISIAATGLMIFDFTKEAIVIANIEYLYYAFTFIFTMIATYFAYKLIFNIFRSGKLKYFSIYCFIVGFLAIALYIIL